MSLIERLAIWAISIGVVFVAGLGFGYKWASADGKEAQVITKTVTETVEKVVPLIDNTAIGQAKAEASAAQAVAASLKSQLEIE